MPSFLRIAFAIGVLCAIGLVIYGRVLVPTTHTLGMVAVTLLLGLYGIIGWLGPRTIGENWPSIRSACVPFGLVGGFIFASEVVLEYWILPADNSRMGVIEFSLVFLIYATAGTLVTYQGCGQRSAIIASVATAMISSLIWYIVVLATFYTYFGTIKQQLVFQAEGNYEDFARSGVTDFDAWVMEDFLGAGFYHLLLGPMIAAALGVFGGIVGQGLRSRRKTRHRVTLGLSATGSEIASLPDPRPVQPGDHAQHDGQERGRDKQAAEREPQWPAEAEDHRQRAADEDEEPIRHSQDQVDRRVRRHR
jgi:hypothetical protein